MLVKERIREKLLASYEGLTPLEKALVQLCSVIYEPTSASTILKCFSRTGLSFAGEEVSTAKDLAPHLNKLQTLRLLDKDYRCHDTIVEIATRKAVEEGLIYGLGQVVRGIESETDWTMEGASRAPCLLCRKKRMAPFFNTARGPLCLSCAEGELEAVAAKEDFFNWSAGQFKEALSSSGDLRRRLAVLWRIRDAERIGGFYHSAGANEFMALIVRNLGYSHNHPLDRTIRQAALDACIEMGVRILPLLLKMFEQEPSLYYANLVLAVGKIAPDNSEVKAILIKAARSHYAEVRHRVLDAVANQTAPWAFQLIEEMTKDPVSAISRSAKEILSRIKARGRRAARGLEPLFRSEPISPAASADYGPLVRAVRQEMPSDTYFFFNQKTCPRAMRELRIGLYSNDAAIYRKYYERLRSNCPAYIDPDPFVRICNNPFDAGWLGALPSELQVHVIAETFSRTFSHLLPDSDVLAYALSLDDNFLKSISPTDKPNLFYALSGRLIMGGRLEEAGRLISQFRSGGFTGGLEGWLNFVEGKNDQAIDSFESDLKELRKRSGKRNSFFERIGGLFFILALLRRQEPALVKRVDQLVESALSKEYPAPFMKPAFLSLKALIHIQNLELDEARRILNQNQKHPNKLASFFFALASYWLDGRLGEETIDTVSRIFIKARELELHWLAMECAELLRRVEDDTPIRRNYIDKIQSETGMKSFISSIKIEAPWQRSLRALIVSTSADQGAGAVENDRRLAWFFQFDKGDVSLRAVEQKLTAKGSWSKGRSVSLSRLRSGEGLDFMTRQDQLICSAIKVGTSYYYGTDYEFEVEKALPHLVGHPAVFLEGTVSVPVEIVKAEPEVLVMQAGSELNISFSVPVGDERVKVIQETPTRFKVMEFSEGHRRIARVLGEKGLSVPASASEEVLAAIAGISSHVIVHSAIGGKSKDIIDIDADPTPHAHLLPSGAGFRLELFVKPFGAEGPYLKPGAGVENVIAEVGGRRMHTKRNLSLEEKRASSIENCCLTLAQSADSDRQWNLDTPEACLQVLVDLKNLQEKGEVVVDWPEGEKLKITREVSFDKLRMSIQGRSNWFEVSGELRVDDNLVFDMKRLLDLLRESGSRFIPLGEGQFLALTKELRKRLDELDAFSEKKGREIRLNPFAALAIEELTDQLSQLEVDEAWKSKIERVHAAQNLDPVVPSTLRAELRDYQMEGYRWLTRLAFMGMGACLADDMGLGKTIQALSVLLDRAPNGPALVVAPTSVCMNWVTEADRFAPTLNVSVFGNGDREKLVKGLGPMDLLVSSYGLMYQEIELLSSVEWNTIVLDEAQAIKNVLTKRSQAAMSLNGSFKMITTGTPIENHLGEFWTLFNFINPGLLGSHKRFNDRFAIPVEKFNDREAGKRLKKLIQPFILRRLKSQVLEELPPRTEVVLQVEMSEKEEAFYEALRRQALERIAADKSPLIQKQLRILAEIMKLRQAACNPRLVVPETNLSSSKLELFGEVISELLESRHKALVFSQFVGHLKLIREYLDSKSIKYRYLDGSTPPKERKREVDAFQSGEGDLFLISLKAGGLGLNLTAADYVIHMDPWWNPAVEDQASDRAHRIGQKRPVTVYRLVARNTIEEKIVKLHQEKRDLAGSLLDGSDISGKISAEELLKLIKEQ